MVSSQVIDNNLNPKWDEDFKLLVHEPEHQVRYLSRPCKGSATQLRTLLMDACLACSLPPPHRAVSHFRWRHPMQSVGWSCRYTYSWFWRFDLPVQRAEAHTSTVLASSSHWFLRNKSWWRHSTCERNTRQAHNQLHRACVEARASCMHDVAPGGPGTQCSGLQPRCKRRCAGAGLYVNPASSELSWSAVSALCMGLIQGCLGFCARLVG